MMRTDKALDERISRWLEVEAPAQLPDRVLRATFERTRATTQRRGWRSLLGRVNLNQSMFAVGGTAVVVLTAALAVGIYVNSGVIGRLPSSPEDWSRVAIGTRFATAQIDENKLAVSSRGLLALVGELGSGAFELAVSSNGYDWTDVPSEAHPALQGHRIKLIGNDRGFVMFVDNDVWASDDGFRWQHLAGPVDDADLRQGDILTAIAGGPGLVALGGDNTAWYSTDGSDWTLAEVPPPPVDFGGRDYSGPRPTVNMEQVAISGDVMVAWGKAFGGAAETPIVESVVWTSRDGETWTDVVGPQLNSVNLAGGPRGFVAIGGFVHSASDPAATSGWFSADGRQWERSDYAFESNPGGSNSAFVEAVGAGGSGFVAVGYRAECGQCSGTEARVWTSADGRNWSSLAADAPFTVVDGNGQEPGARATSVVAWGPRFVVAGQYDGRPVAWISGPEQSRPVEPRTPPAGITAAPSVSSAPFPGAFVGGWEATDVDGSHQTMAVAAQADATYEVTILDAGARVCGDTPSTLTGVGSSNGSSGFVVAQPVYECDDGRDPRLIDPLLDEYIKDLTFVYDSERDQLEDSLGLVWSRPSQGTPPSPSPAPSVAPISWGPQSADQDWPAPPRSEIPAAPIESSEPVAPGWTQYSDADADTTPEVVAAVDIHTVQVGNGCATGQPLRTCIELTLSGWVDVPRPDPEDAWFGFGIVVDSNADGVADERYGVDNSGRAWKTDLSTGATVTAPASDERVYAEFPPGVAASGGDTPEAIFHLAERGFRFYGWSSLVADGRVRATDYAPDSGWLEVPDPIVGSWEGTDMPPDRSHLTMGIVSLPDGTYDLTVRDDSAAVCEGTSSTMVGIAALTEPGAIVIEQPDYTCDDGSEPTALSGPPLQDQLRNYRFTYSPERDELVDGGGVVFTRVTG